MRFVVVLLTVTLAGCVFYDPSGVPFVPANEADADMTRPDAADMDTRDGDAPCESESDADLCQRLVLNCGPLTAEDNCGNSRSVDCGQCTLPAICGGGGTPNVCACSEQSDVEFCALFAECGPVTELDACGQMRTVDCGACEGAETCGGGGMPGVCGCATESDIVFCARQDACGLFTAEDNCGLPRSADCGGCPDGESCSAENRCVCQPEADAAFCTRLRGCGSVTAVDNCNTARTVECGTCAGGEACENNQCACTTESDQAFCARLGAMCDDVTAPDNCGAARTATCGTCAATEVCNAGVCDAAFPPAGIETWLRSDDGVTLSMQGEVTEWVDRLSGEIWAAPAISARPTFIIGQQAGFPALRFFGGQRIKRAASPLSSPQMTLFAVAVRTMNTDRDGPIMGLSTVATNEFDFGTTPTTMRFESSSAGLSFTASVLPTTSVSVITIRAGGGSFEFFQGNQLTASTPFTATGSFMFDQIGATTTIRGLRGDLYELMLWPRALNDAERAAVVGYLRGRYGL